MQRRVAPGVQPVHVNKKESNEEESGLNDCWDAVSAAVTEEAGTYTRPFYGPTLYALRGIRWAQSRDQSGSGRAGWWTSVRPWAEGAAAAAAMEEARVVMRQVGSTTSFTFIAVFIIIYRIPPANKRHHPRGQTS